MIDKSLYDQDFYAWANKQAGLLRSRRYDLMDVDNIAEEIECLAKREKRELTDRLRLLMVLLLKWQFQPGLRSKGYQMLVAIQRTEVADRLSDNPSLSARLPELIAHAYGSGRMVASIDTHFDLEMFPATCPYSFGQMVAEEFWPGGD
jgi:hypothetical protein